MILLRILLLGGIVWLVWMAWRQLRPSQPEAPPDAFEPMLKCCVCEAHVPRAQAIDADGKTYCKDHAPKRP